MRINRVICVILVVACVIGMSSCSLFKEDVTLTLWGPSEATEMLQQMVNDFVEENKGSANFNITVGVQEEKSVGEVMRKSRETAADVFIFPSDQLHYLISENILLPITENKEQIIADNGGADSGSISAATKDGALYAYPQTSSNGYFMFYDKSFFNENDIKSLDAMLKIAEDNGKYVSIDWASGWYIYSFFGGAGFTLEMNSDGNNTCNWNDEINGFKGTDIAQSMLDISKSKGFLDCGDDALKRGFADGSIIAGINGTWNAQYISSQLGDNYGACMLPTYTLCGKQVQMGSFAGYKYVGVNSATSNSVWASRLAAWITSYDNQLLLFNKRGECPSNIEAAKSSEVQAAPAIVALNNQSRYAHVQNVGGNYWNAATVFGTIMSSGNPDNIPLQTIMDDLVEASTMPEK